MILQMSSGLISIHALREEGDTSSPRRSARSRNFYPRPPRGGRPQEQGELAKVQDISIHALREEGDLQDFSSSTR